MRALTWQGNEKVEVIEVADPVIEKPTDAIIKVTSTAICGSDLHLYGVLGPYLSAGDVLGHESMGIVEGGRGGGHPHSAWRSGGDPVQYLLRPLLDVYSRALRPV